MTSTSLVTIWRRELVNINKTRDNHLAYLGQHFDHSLLVRNDQEIGEHISRFGTRVVHISTFGLGFVGFWINAIFRIRKLQKTGKVDAVVLPIGEEPLALFFRLIWGSRVNTPKIILDLWDVPGLALEGSDRSLLKKTMRNVYLSLLPRFLKSSNLIICGVVPDPFLNMGVDVHKIIETENGVNRDSFHSAVPTHDIWNQLPQVSANSINLLYQGYIHEARGALIMVNSLKQLRDNGHDVRLLMIGPSTSPEIESIEQLAETLLLAEYVVIQKAIPSDQIPSVIAGAHICLCPLKDIEKFRWSYPVKIYEYMAMGKAIVASTLPGTQRLIQHRKLGGCLYSSADRSGMLNQLTWLIENPELSSTLALTGSEFVNSKSWEENVAKIANSINTKL